MRFPFVIFAVSAQAGPLAVSTTMGCTVFAAIVLITVALQLYVSSVTIVARKVYFSIILLALTAVSYAVTFSGGDARVAALVSSSAALIVFCDWLTARTALAVFSVSRIGERGSRPPGLGAYIAIVLCNVRQFVADLGDAARYGVHRGHKWRVLGFGEAVVSFFVHIYRFGRRISHTSRIRNFSFQAADLAPDQVGVMRLAWALEVVLVVTLLASALERI